MSTMDQSVLALHLGDASAPQAPASVTAFGHELALALFGTLSATPANVRRRRFGPALIVLVSAVLHGLLAVSVARARPDIRTFTPHARVRITVTRPPEPVKPAEVPLAVIEPPRRRPPPVVKKKLLAPEPQPVHATEVPPPPPDEPVLAKTEATDPGAVVGSADGSLTGTGVVGGARGGTGVALPPALPPAPLPIVQAHEGAGYLKNPRPPYPDLAQRRGWEGQVLLRVHVSPSGQVEGATVKSSSGRELLDEAAIAAVRAWTFVPARRGPTPIAGWVEVPIVFKLQ